MFNIGIRVCYQPEFGLDAEKFGHTTPGTVIGYNRVRYDRGFTYVLELDYEDGSKKYVVSARDREVWLLRDQPAGLGQLRRDHDDDFLKHPRQWVEEWTGKPSPVRTCGDDKPIR